MLRTVPGQLRVSEWAESSGSRKAGWSLGKAEVQAACWKDAFRGGQFKQDLWKHEKCRESIPSALGRAGPWLEWGRLELLLLSTHTDHNVLPLNTVADAAESLAELQSKAATALP